MAEPRFDAPIPGMGMAHELGARPWQNPPLYNTVEEALDYYIPRMASTAFSSQLLDIMATGIPLTTLANTVQMAGVMDGKHSADVGILILPVLIEMMRFLGDSADVDYATGLDEDTSRPRTTLVNKAISELRKEETKEDTVEEPMPKEQTELPLEEPSVEEPTGLMARRV